MNLMSECSVAKFAVEKLWRKSLQNFCNEIRVSKVLGRIFVAVKVSRVKFKLQKPCFFFSRRVVFKL